LFESDTAYGGFVGRDSFYGWLASQRGELFRDEEFAGLYVLTNSMGIPAQFEHPRYLFAVRRIIAAAEAAGKTTGIMAGSVQDAKLALDQGFRIVAYSGDLWLYQTALRDGLAAIRAHDGAAIVRG
jgi:2-dehydro-3-deoxyglucarate aldolase/4-hydroxy-2-oxoheptanedioate aldolase